MNRPSKIPDSFLRQPNMALDPTSHLAAAKTITCFHCDQTMRGDLGIQTAYKLAGTEVRIHVILHKECVP